MDEPYSAVATASSFERIDLIRHGVSFHTFSLVASDLGLSPRKLCKLLGVRWDRVARGARTGQALDRHASESVVDVMALISLVTSLLTDREHPTETALAWMSDWLVRPQPALAGGTPDSLIDTREGRNLLKNLILQSFAGAFG